MTDTRGGVCVYHGSYTGYPCPRCIDADIGVLLRRLDRQAATLDSYDRCFELVAERIERLEARIAELETRIASLEASKRRDALAYLGLI